MQDKKGNVEANGDGGIEGIDTISSSIDTLAQIRQFFAALLTSRRQRARTYDLFI